MPPRKAVIVQKNEQQAPKSIIGDSLKKERSVQMSRYRGRMDELEEMEYIPVTLSKKVAKEETNGQEERQTTKPKAVEQPQNVVQADYIASLEKKIEDMRQMLEMLNKPSIAPPQQQPVIVNFHNPQPEKKQAINPDLKSKLFKI